MGKKLGRPKNFSGFYEGGLVELFDDLTIIFSGSMLDEILKQYNAGKTFEEIAKYMKRDPDEIFLALFHLARQNKKIRPVGKRYA